MAWHRRHGGAACAVAVLAAGLALAMPSPPEARANIACDLGVAPAAPITGALGLGNPVSDACNAVTDDVVGAATAPVAGRRERGQQRHLQPDHHLGRRRRRLADGPGGEGDRTTSTIPDSTARASCASTAR